MNTVGLVVSSLLVGLLGCADFGGDDDVGEVSEGIVGARADKSNDAVVAVLTSSLSTSQLCTGTIIAQYEDGKAFAITAAHCPEPAWIYATEDLDDCPGPFCGTYPVSQFWRCTLWTGGPLCDLMLIEFQGPPGLPVLPWGRADALAVGSTFEVSGFGLHDSGGGVTMNGQRYHSFNAVDVAGPTEIEFKQTHSARDGGFCDGDGGAPIIGDDAYGVRSVLGTASSWPGAGGGCIGPSIATRAAAYTILFP